MKMKMKRGAGRVLFLRSDRVGHMCSGLRSVSLVNPDGFQSRRNLHSAPQSVVPDLPVSITGELVRNANSRARLTPTGSVFLEGRPNKGLGFAVPPGDSDTCES